MDMIRILAIAALATVSLAGTALAQDSNVEFSSLQEMMSAKEFVDSGLHELSQQQLDALNVWIQNNMTAAPGPEGGRQSTSSGQSGGDQRGFSGRGQSNDIRSRIPGEFKGWFGYTEFTLENGMVWQQTGSDTMKGVRLTDPEVRIYQGFVGSWRLEVEGINKTTTVKRIK